MTLMWWGIAAFLLTLGLAWVLLPLFGEALPWRAELREDDARRLIKREKAKALRRIKDLELEREAGTIDANDFEWLKQAAMEEVVLLNRRLDDLAGLSENDAKSAAGDAAAAEIPVGEESEAKS